MPPRFSIFTPVLDGAEWLPGAIASVAAQSLGDWELIVGDNASGQDLGAIVAGFADPRIRYHRWPVRTDIFANFNRTMELTNAPWVTLLCVDDRLHPRYLEEVARWIDEATTRRRRLAMVITAARRLGRDGEPIDVDYYGLRGVAAVAPGYHDAASWLAAVCSPGSAPWDGGTYSRAVIDAMGVFYRVDRPRMSADLELSLRIAAYGDIAYVDEPLLDVSGWSGSHTHGRRARNRALGDRYTPEASALLIALRAHEQRRKVSEHEHAQVHAAIARSFLRRAAGHRYLPGGRGRRGALLDIARALRYAPSAVLGPRAVVYSLADILAPRVMLVAVRRRILSRRARLRGQRLVA